MTIMSVLTETRLPRLEPAPALERETMAVSILIVTWNSAPWIERCLTSIETASGGLRYEVLVFDNASNDGTAAIVRSRGGDRINCFESPVNLGFAGAMNRLIEKAKGEYLLCLNADAEPESGSIAKLVEHLERNPDVAGAVPLLSHDDGASQHEWQLRSLPSMRSIAAEVLLLDKILPRNDWSRNDYRGIDLADVQQVEQPAAAAMLLRKSVVRSIGAFDESFTPAWFEDVDYCKRIADAGMSIDLVPSARASHVGGASLEQMPFDEFITVWYRNLHRYVKKWFSPAQAETVRWMIVAGMLLRIVVTSSFLVRTPPPRRVALRGYWTVLKEALARWSVTSRSSS